MELALAACSVMNDKHNILYDSFLLVTGTCIGLLFRDVAVQQAHGVPQLPSREPGRPRMLAEERRGERLPGTSI